jgi:hypothetical protein
MSRNLKCTMQWQINIKESLISYFGNVVYTSGREEQYVWVSHPDGCPRAIAERSNMLMAVNENDS